MAEFMSMKLKRKDLDDVNDEFSDFSLSSPARKIRRLDGGLPPIIEEEEAEIPLALESFVGNDGEEKLKPVIIEELPATPKNEERAIVLFKPMNMPLLQSPSNFSVDPDLISAYKNQAFWTAQSNSGGEDDSRVSNEDNFARNECTAVIPWVPHQQIPQSPLPNPSRPDTSESMDAEEMEAATMEIEDPNVPILGQGQESEYSSPFGINEGLQHQWQHQQHCLIPQPPQNNAAPIVWYR